MKAESKKVIKEFREAWSEIVYQQYDHPMIPILKLANSIPVLKYMIYLSQTHGAYFEFMHMSKRASAKDRFIESVRDIQEVLFDMGCIYYVLTQPRTGKVIYILGREDDENLKNQLREQTEFDESYFEKAYTDKQKDKYFRTGSYD